MNRSGTDQERQGHSFFNLLNLLLLSVLLAFSAGAVWAQDEEPATDEDEEEPADLGRVEVTGSLLRREEFTSTSPVQIINAETQAQVGQLSVGEILQKSTVAAGTTQLNTQFTGFVIQGGTGVQTLDLRGLGASRTLTILNGRRPGGSGTRGEVQALDLATIPEIAAQRFEVLLDGSSSIYGSDAVAGVANIITRRSVDRSEFQALTDTTEESGGELYRVSGITGKNWARGAFTLSGQWELRKELTIADRDFLSCPQDLFTDAAGNRIDREDRSITAGTPLSGCSNLYANTFIDLFTGARYIPSPDGVTIGNFPGYRPRVSGRYDDGDGEPAYYEDVLNFDFAGSEHARNRLERINVYATGDYSFDWGGGVDWDADFLYSKRETEARNWRQFFPLVSSSAFIPYPNDPDFHPGLALSLPVMPYPSNTDVEVDFIYFTTGLEGMLSTKNFWSWQAYASYSRSDGDYTRNSILASQSGDINFDANAPRIDYFDPAILSGENMQALIDTVGINQTGNTIYDQYQIVGILSGDLFDMPAGTVGAAIGAEYRDFSIDDQPSEASQSGDLWGESSARATKGSNSVYEIFGEIELPLIAGKPGFENLSLNVSARTFDYDVGGSDSVWKAGLKWNVTPSFMMRSTAGTSYRAPALFELFLGDQTGFLGQLGIDPCIDWQNSNNELIRNNCAADGIPGDYTGAGASATVVSGGNAEDLESETSDAFTVGFVLTPAFADLSIAIDYFDLEVNDQIAQLGAGSIVSGCYNAENFPNAFCNLFTRNPGNDPQFPYNIDTVTDTFININQQRTKGIDLNLRWQHDFDIGNLVVEGQTTWVKENISRLFDPNQVQGFEDDDITGRVGSPDLVGNLRATLKRNDWSYNYYLQYVSETDDLDFGDEVTTYFGFEDARRDLTMDEAFYHSISVFYQKENWDLLVGINNLLDEEPDTYSSAFRARRGNVPISATQYDYLGRRLFVRFKWRM